jgi:uncharacterized protein YlzI (FlbEa/FlbD family)
MVIFTTPQGHQIGLNPDLIECASAEGAVTAVRLVDGRQHLVCESLGQIAAQLLAYRTAIIDGPATRPAGQHRPATLRLLR